MAFVTVGQRERLRIRRQVERDREVGPFLLMQDNDLDMQWVVDGGSCLKGSEDRREKAADLPVPEEPVVRAVFLIVF